MAQLCFGPFLLVSEALHRRRESRRESKRRSRSVGNRGSVQDASGIVILTYGEAVRQDVTGQRVEATKDCAICMGAFDKESHVGLTRCGHVFCISCLEEHLKRATFAHCPLCRKALSEQIPATSCPVIEEGRRSHPVGYWGQ
eukprot:gnl/MRDRNA2_/MRDRNA2_20144_c0_seq1.p1 gnl/MRDRNA2_/MRDRNA2_20144_c0~~gnl/MRDRNA2_/MRDRNA2_20144_c0_seq1.p1  ORF type:complete len:142 (+),score=14.27 gnl/MRDRNA2_/MRDRNA2_20144_c0_seq1:114-539(+)